MDTRRYRLQIVARRPESEWSALHAALVAQGTPAIAMERSERTVTFTAATGAFMLQARVAEALADVFGPERDELFAPAEPGAGPPAAAPGALG